MKNLTLKQHTQITSILFWGGIAITLIGSIYSNPLDPHWLLWVGVAVFLSAFLYRLIFIHCPYCHDLWAGMPTIPEYCPKCGKKLQPPYENKKYEE